MLGLHTFQQYLKILPGFSNVYTKNDVKGTRHQREVFDSTSAAAAAANT